MQLATCTYEFFGKRLFPFLSGWHFWMSAVLQFHPPGASRSDQHRSHLSSLHFTSWGLYQQAALDPFSRHVLHHCRFPFSPKSLLNDRTQDKRICVTVSRPTSPTQTARSIMPLQRTACSAALPVFNCIV